MKLVVPCGINAQEVILRPEVWGGRRAGGVRRRICRRRLHLQSMRYEDLCRYVWHMSIFRYVCFATQKSSFGWLLTYQSSSGSRGRNIELPEIAFGATTQPTLIPFHTQLKKKRRKMAKELLSLRCWCWADLWLNIMNIISHHLSKGKPRRETLQEFISTAMNQRFFWKYLALFTHSQAGLKCCPMLMLLTGLIFGRY